MNFKRVFAVVCALAFAFVAVSCSCGEEDKEYEQKITVCFAEEPETMDPAKSSTVDAAIMLLNAFSGLYGYEADANGNPKLVAECAESIVTPTNNGNGTYTYVITLKEGLKWSNGTDMKASDFIYSWNRAASGTGDYAFLYEVFSGNDELVAGTADTMNISADDTTRKITITTAYYCAYFDQLLAFPTFFPVCPSVVEAHPNWASNDDYYVSNGAFCMERWTTNSEIVFKKNVNYVNAANVKLEKLTFFLSKDDDAVFANFEKGDVQYTTHVPVTQIPVLKYGTSGCNSVESRLGDDFFIGDYIGTWYLEFNVNISFNVGLTEAGSEETDWTNWDDTKNSKVRKALSLLIDRNYIVDSVTQAGQVPADGFVPAGMSDGNGNIFREEADAWYSVKASDKTANENTAIQMLKDLGYNYDETNKKFTNFPKFYAKYNMNTGNEAIITAIQDRWATFGIVMEPVSGDWTTLTVQVRNGDFVCSRMGWIADYNDPINFLEVFLSNSGNNHPQMGKSGTITETASFGPNHDKAWSEYDALISSIKTETDAAARAEKMYTAESWLKEESFVMPIYYYTNPYLVSPHLKGYLYSSLGWVSFKYAYME